MFRETFSPDYPAPIDPARNAPQAGPLEGTPGCTIIPRYRDRPRVSLRNGSIVAHSIQLSPGVSVPTALDLACRLSHATGHPVSVPVSGPVSALPAHVVAALDRTGLPPARLELVLTEAAVAHCGPEALLALATLRDQGVGIALSDFGIGNLDILDRVPVSTLILAPSLLANVPGDASATTLLHALMRLAARDNLAVVATGIETEGQRALLSGLGCAEGEGPMFGPATLRRS